VYRLFARALEESELAAVAKFVMRQRQHLGALRVRDGVLALEQLYFADEIRPTEDIDTGKERVGKEELAMARQLIEQGTTRWKPERYKDTYRDELKAAIEAKRKGKDVHAAPEVEGDEKPIDLLEALRASVERNRRSKSASRKSSSRRKRAAA
jgi:DNA end-binding protein Ku